MRIIQCLLLVEVGECPSPADVAHARLVPEACDSVTSHVFGGSVTYACDDGYALYGGNLTRTCGEDGRWSGSPPTCAGEGLYYN